MKYRDFVSKGENGGVMITGGTGKPLSVHPLCRLPFGLSLHSKTKPYLFSGGHPSSTEDFNPLWISEFKKTNAYEVWERTTDPLLFDIVEPRSVLGIVVFTSVYSFSQSHRTDIPVMKSHLLLLILASDCRKVSKILSSSNSLRLHEKLWHEH